MFSFFKYTLIHHITPSWDVSHSYKKLNKSSLCNGKDANKYTFLVNSNANKNIVSHKSAVLAY